MSYIDAIKNRHSVRNYRADSIEDKKKAKKLSEKELVLIEKLDADVQLSQSLGFKQRDEKVNKLDKGERNLEQ